MEVKIFSLCGLECTDCPCFLAFKNNNDNFRKKIAQKWSREFGWKLNPEDINCTGCLTQDNPHFKHCFKCKVRKCGLEKEVVNCGLCKKYSSCLKIKSLHRQIPEGKNYCDNIIIKHKK